MEEKSERMTGTAVTCLITNIQSLNDEKGVGNEEEGRNEIGGKGNEGGSVVSCLFIG